MEHKKYMEKNKRREIHTMKNKFKAIVSIILVAITALSLCACGDKAASQNAEANNQAAKQFVYSYEDLDLGIDLNNVSVNGVDYINDRLYLLFQDYSGQYTAAGGAKAAVMMPSVEVEVEVEDAIVDVEDDSMEEEEYVYTGPVYVVASVKLDGTDAKQVVLSNGENPEPDSYMSRVIFAGDGGVIGVQESYIEDNTDPMNPIWKSVNYLMRWDAEGNLLWKKDMTEYVGDVEYYYPRDMFVMEDGSLMFFSWEGLGATVDMDGNMIAPIEMDPEKAQQMGSLFRSSDGTLYMTSYNDQYTKMYISTLDIKTGTEGEKVELPGTMNNYSFYQGYNTDFVVTNSTGIYTYNVGDEAPVQIMDFINSDFPATWINNLVIIDDTHMIGSYNDQIDWKMHFGYFTKVNPEDVPDKNTLMLGCMYLDYNVRSRVIEFNKSNPLYRITIKDYSTYSTMDDYMAGYTQLNNDIISNQVPDILLVDSDMDVNNYINKGVLADLNEMIANDEELKDVELLSNVVDAFSVDDKMYTLVPGFSIKSLMGKTSNLEGRTSWTMEEFMEFAESLPEGTTPFTPEMVRDSFIWQVMNFLGSDFVDPVTGKCSFDSQEFINILEYTKTLPKEIPEDYWMDIDWNEYDAMYRNDKVMLMEVNMSNIRDLKYQIKGYMGDDVTFIGFPTAEGNGSVIQLTSNGFAISARSAFKDGAWEFVRYYLTDDYQSSDQLYAFPIVKSAFLKKAALATEKPYWTDENGNKVEYDDTYYIGGEEIILEPFTQEEVDKICEFIYSVNKVNNFDADIRDIIIEEAAYFFEGQKSAQEVATVIQSRAQIFIDENR